MQFESLPNELILESFEYLDGVRLICAFHNLNSRFNTLLFVYFRRYYFDFRSVSKHDFDLICRQWLPSIDNRVSHMCLSNDDETPMALDIFLMSNATFNRFQQLKSLSLLHINSLEKINVVLMMSSESTLQLINLTINDCFNSNSTQFECLLNFIWNMPKLTRCNLNNIALADISLPSLSTISLSMKSFSVKNLRLSVEDSMNLFAYTPNLQHLRMTLGFDYEIDEFRTASIKLKSLELHLYFSDVGFLCLLPIIPYVHHLTVRIEGFHIDGHKWELLIADYLPNIKSFRLHMKFQHENQGNDEFIDSFLNTFRTHFWLKDHNWFVQCEWNSQETSNIISLYTLPMLFDECYEVDSNIRFKSTVSNDQLYHLQHSAHNIIIGSDVDAYSSKFNYFHEIKSLKMTLPTNDISCCIMSALISVTSLYIVSNECTILVLSQLESLINQAPCLYLLAVDEYLALQVSQLKVTNKSLRRIDCFQRCQSFHIYFNTDECSNLANSILGQQCEVIGIQVESGENIIDLVRIMPNLRALICECQRDKFYNKHSSASWNADLLLEQLRDGLPKKCLTYRDSQNSRRIRVWIEK